MMIKIKIQNKYYILLKDPQNQKNEGKISIKIDWMGKLKRKITLTKTKKNKMNKWGTNLDFLVKIINLICFRFFLFQ